MKAIEELSFEAALKELEETSVKLSDGNLPLADMVKLYERGDALARRCTVLLDAYEARIDMLTPGKAEDTQ